MQDLMQHVTDLRVARCRPLDWHTSVDSWVKNQCIAMMSSQTRRLVDAFAAALAAMLPANPTWLNCSVLPLVPRMSIFDRLKSVR